jgi:hypothetical protein
LVFGIWVCEREVWTFSGFERVVKGLEENINNNNNTCIKKIKNDWEYKCGNAGVTK